MSELNKSFKDIFKQEQKNRGDEVIEEAQRLVNLYRHAEAFGEEFMAKLDEMLLDASPEVQTALSNILGGQVVRQYCLFLKDKKRPKEKQSDEKEEVLQQKGYLPKPTATESAPAGGSNTDSAALEMFAELLKSQSETTSALLKRFDQHTHEMTPHQTEQLINALKQESGKQKSYSDIIESTGQTPVLVPDEMEGF